MRRQHDVGGLDGGPINLVEPAEEPWAKMSQAIFNVMPRNGHVSLHALRRAVEDLPEEIYNTSYYGRRAEAMRNLFEESGILTRAELEDRMAIIKKRLAPGP